MCCEPLGCDEHQAEHYQEDGEERTNGDENSFTEGIPGLPPRVSVFSSNVGFVDGRVVFKIAGFHTFFLSGRFCDPREVAIVSFELSYPCDHRLSCTRSSWVECGLDSRAGVM